MRHILLMLFLSLSVSACKPKPPPIPSPERPPVEQASPKPMPCPEPPPESTPPDPLELEQKAWEEALAENSARGYRRYRAAYPRSARAPEALKRILDPLWEKAAARETYETLAAFLSMGLSDPRGEEAMKALLEFSRKQRKKILQGLAPVKKNTDPDPLFGETGAFAWVPLDEKLLELQEFLSPGSLLSAELPGALLLVYDRTRGADLALERTGIPAVQAQMEEVTVTVEIYRDGVHLASRKGFGGKGEGGIPELYERCFTGLALDGAFRESLEKLLLPMLGMGNGALADSKAGEADPVVLLPLYAVWTRVVENRAYWSERAWAAEQLARWTPSLDPGLHEPFLKRAGVALLSALDDDAPTVQCWIVHSALPSFLDSTPIRSLDKPYRSALYQKILTRAGKPRTRLEALSTLMDMKRTGILDGLDGAHQRVSSLITAEVIRYRTEAQQMESGFLESVCRLFDVDQIREEDRQLFRKVKKAFLFLLRVKDDLARAGWVESFRNLAKTKAFQALPGGEKATYARMILPGLSGLRLDRTPVDPSVKDLYGMFSLQALESLSGLQLGKDPARWSAWVDSLRGK